MNLYGVVLFVHILGAFGLIAALAIESVALAGLQAAQTAEQAHPWLGVYRVLRILAPVSIVALLLAGLDLMASAGGWRAWIVGGLVGLLLVGVIGGLVNGTRMARLGPAVTRASGPLSEAIRRMLHDPVLLLSSRVRIGLVLGVLFLMSAKPDALGSTAALVVGALAGAASTLVANRRRAVPLPGRAG